MSGAKRLSRAGIVVAGAAALAGVAAATATARQDGSTRFTMYAVPKSVQFMNHEDDRRRGMTNNPFEVNRAKSLRVVVKGSEQKDGPFPGDDVLYTFDLYSGAALKHKAGSAEFTCYYDLAKHATCDGYFELPRGLILATGSVVFNSSRFTLAVEGGTTTYLGADGQVTAAPTAKEAQRFRFALE
jgi:hypothetical protein